MASSYYDSSDKIVYDGDIAEAADLNGVNDAVDTSFQLVEADMSVVAAEAEFWAASSEEWAEEAEDSEINPGEYSSLHHAAKALASKNAAETAETNAETAESNAVTAKNAAELAETNAETSETNAAASESAAFAYRNAAQLAETNAAASETAAGLSEVAALASEEKAADWAEELEDVEVETGQYSALHHAAKAAASAVLADASETACAGYEAAVSAEGAIQVGLVEDEGDAQVIIVAAEGTDQYNYINGLSAVLEKDSPTGAAAIPTGTTAQQPTVPAAGDFRFNTTNVEFEGYDGTEWGSIGGGTLQGSSSFVGTGSEVTIAHGVGAIPSAVIVTPTHDPGGYLGEVWCRKDATNIYVGNSGAATGTFDWVAIP